MGPDIPAGLRELAKVLRRIEELNEWGKLSRQERRHDVSPAFQPHDHTESEIQIHASSFIATVMDIHQVLDNPDPNVAERRARHWRRRLQQLEDRFDTLCSTEKLLSASSWTE